MSEEYLDLKALTKRIPFSRSAIEELIAGGELIEGVHFRRPPGPAGKRVFFWTRIEAWVKGEDHHLKAEYYANQNTQRHHPSRFQIQR
jgi:hypothetical protein